MKIGIDIDNVLANFNEILLNDYLEHDKTLNNAGIIHKDEYIRKMFDWDISYEQEYYKNNIERLASLFTPIKDSSKYINKLKEEKESIKNAIIMEEMYKQGFKDGINLIIQCQKI